MISRGTYTTYGLNGGDQFAYAFDARRRFPADADEAIRAAGAGVGVDLDPGSGFLEHKRYSSALDDVVRQPLEDRGRIRKTFRAPICIEGVDIENFHHSWKVERIRVNNDSPQLTRKLRTYIPGCE